MLMRATALKAWLWKRKKVINIKSRLAWLIFPALLLIIAPAIAQPTIENVSSAITNESAIITWDTDNLSNSAVNYNSTLGLGNLAYNYSNVSQGHQVPLNDLAPNTFYYFNVTSCDNSTNCSMSGPYNFTTDDKPLVSTVVVSPAPAYTFNDLTCNATVTDSKNTTLTVEYFWYNESTLMLSGNTTGVSNGTNSLISTLGSANTTIGEIWNCTVRAYDGNYYSGALYSERAIWLLVENITNTSTTNDSSLITWDTDENATSDVDYGPTLNITLSALNSSNVSQGHQVLLDSLSPNIMYFYRITTCIPGTCLVTITYNFTTDGPPTLANITNASTINVSTLITWLRLK